MSDHQPDLMNSTAQYKSIIDRIERLESEKSEIGEQIKEVYAEAKGNGYDTKQTRKLVRIRKKDKAKAREERAILETYALALGDLELADLA